MPLLAISTPSATAACLNSGRVPAEEPQKTAMRRNAAGGGADGEEGAGGAAGIAVDVFFCVKYNRDLATTLVPW